MENMALSNSVTAKKACCAPAAERAGLHAATPTAVGGRLASGQTPRRWFA